MIWTCLLACGVLIYAEYARHAKLRIGAKVIASASFVVMALPALGGGPFQNWMVIGLVLGAIGDLALLGRGGRAFLGGLGAFLAGHIAYVIGLAQLESPLYWPIYAGALGMMAILGGVIVLRWLWPNLGMFKGPVVIYVIAIVSMVMGAFAVQSTGGLPAPERDFLAIGAALFFLSDLAVARERFVARDFKNKAYGLPTYYGAQLLIAAAIT